MYQRTYILAAVVLISYCHPLSADQIFRFGPWTGSAELDFSLQRQESASIVGGDTLFDREVSEEKLALRSSFGLRNRKLLDVTYGFTLGLLQSSLITDRQEGEGRGELQAFDLTATFLPLSTYRPTLTLSRSVNVTPVEFSGTRDLRSDVIGLNLDLGSKRFPGSIRVRQLDIESTNDFGAFSRGLDQRRRNVSYTGNQRWTRHQLFASFRIDDFEDRISPSLSHLSQTVSLNHELEVLRPKLVTLRSIFRYFDRGGGLDSSSIYLDEEIRLRHRSYLSSSLRYVNESLDSFSGSPTTSQRLLLGIHHTVYQSLVTEVLVGRSTTKSDGGSSGVDGAELDSVYTKQLPGNGTLRARLTARHERRDNLEGNGEELVRDERHVARFGVPVTLDRPAVVAESIVVSDELRSILYEEGADYELLLIGEFAELTPLAGGRIRDGQLILVEYRVEVPSQTISTTQRQGFDFSLDFGWFEPFGGIRRVENELVEGVFDRLLEDQQDMFVGIRLRKTAGRLTVVSFNELRSRESQLQSYRSLRFGESFVYQPRPSWTFRLRLAHQSLDFSIPERETRISDGQLTIKWTRGPMLSVEAFTSGRLSTDSTATDQTFTRYGVRGRWRIGKITVLGSVEQWQRDRQLGGVELENFEGLTTSLRISRNIFPGRLSTPRRRKTEPWPADMPGLWAQPRAQRESSEGSESVELEKSMPLATTESTVGTKASFEPLPGPLSATTVAVLEELQRRLRKGWLVARSTMPVPTVEPLAVSTRRVAP